MSGRPSAGEIFHVANFAGAIKGRSEVISPACGGVRMNSRRAASFRQAGRVQ